MNSEKLFYSQLLSEIRKRISSSQAKIITSVNSELIMMYWDIGRMINIRQAQKGWGSKIIKKLSQDIKNEFPEIKGFSERNFWRMLLFYKEYPSLLGQKEALRRDRNTLATIPPTALAELEDVTSAILPSTMAKLETKTSAIVPTPLAQLEKEDKYSELCNIILQIPWSHNLFLMESLKDIGGREWYARQVLAYGWSFSTLKLKLKNQEHLRAGQAQSNFSDTLPKEQYQIAQQLLKDPYIFDFLTLTDSFQERELETGLLLNLEKFLLELGQGFAFVGKQYLLQLDDNDYYVDLLFYHLKLRCYVVVELKKGKFKPEYAGKINFYCNLIDDKLAYKDDAKTIGLILCQEKNKIEAEYSLRNILKPIGVSEYELTRALPEEFKSSLPSVEEIELELSAEIDD